jgi:hypothetical protein
MAAWLKIAKENATIINNHSQDQTLLFLEK